MRNQSRYFLLALAGATALSSPVWAAAAAEPTAIEEVVVTATRTETSAQKTPISMTVYSTQEIKSSGIHDIASLAAIDPSVNITTSTGAAYVAIRGVASTDVTEIGDPSVPIARDGYFTNRSFGIFAGLYDVQRIEVLKGPQGTLFGRNSTGGLINIISARPTDDFSGYASAELGNYSARNFEGALNIPLGEWAAFRVSGLSRQHDGYRNTLPATVRGDDEDVKSIRAQLQVKPIEGLTALVRYQHDQQDGVGDVSASTPLGTFFTGDPKRTPLYTDPSVKLRTDRWTWEVSYANLPGDLTLTYSGGIDHSHWEHALDATPLPVASSPREQFIQEENPRTINHEIRLATPSDGRFFAQVGAFYFKENNDPLHSGLQYQSGPLAGRYLIHFDYAVETISKAVFGQASFKVTDDLKLTAGARYTHDEKTRVGNAALDCEVAGIPFFVWPFIGCNGYPPLLLTPGNGHIEESKPTFHLGVDYNLTSSNLLYAKFDTGYKSGGFNSNGSAPSVPYGPETMQAFEVGSKNRFMDNRVQFNLAAFLQNYDGYQASQFTPALGGGPGIQNAGSARIYGVEASVDALIDPVGRIFADATWLHGRFTDFKAIDPTGVFTQDLSGNALPNAPDFTITGGVEHTWDLGGGALTGHIDAKYQSKAYFGFFNLADTRQPAYTTGNFWVSYAPAAAPWELQFFVRNFTDETVFTNARQNTLANADNFEFAPPRTIGGKVTVRW